MANGGNGIFEATTTKVGCYCYVQNCHGDEDGIGCWNCVDLAMKKGDFPTDDVEPGVCRFDCDICKCSCQATFAEKKRHTISNGLKKNAMKCNPVEQREVQREGSRSLFFDDNYTV